MISPLVSKISIALGLAHLALAAPAVLEVVKKGDEAGLKRLLASKPDVNAADPDGSTPLHVAAQQGRTNLALMLIDAGAKIDAATRYNVTPLSIAAANGDVVLMDRLLKAGADPNNTSSEGQTILMSAARNGSADAVKLLLARGAKINAIEPFRGQSALMWAAGEGNAAALDMLIEFGADVKLKSKAGWTAFLFAVRNRQVAAVKTLLAHGANVNDRAPDGTPALHVAVLNTYYELASLLLDAGANPNVADDPNGSPLHSLGWLRKPGTPWEAAALGEDPVGPPREPSDVNSYDLAEKLLKKGADPNARVGWKEMRMTKGLGTTRNPPNLPLGRHYLSFVGSTPFYNAARNGDATYMKLLVKYGADPKITTAVGVTPLMAATGLDYYEGETPGPYNGVTEAERLEAVKLCVQLGIDINAHTDFGKYPMPGTAEFTLLTYPTNFEELAGLGIGDPRWTGMTALHGAVISNQPSIVKYMIEAGAELNAKNRLGWTPLMMTRGVFMANSKKEFPVAREILTEAMKAKGIPVE